VSAERIFLLLVIARSPLVGWRGQDPWVWPAQLHTKRCTGLQMRMKDFAHAPQLCVKGRAPKIAEGSASPALREAAPQCLSTSNTLKNGRRIQALLFSSLVCNLPRCQVLSANQLSHRIWRGTARNLFSFFTSLFRQTPQLMRQDILSDAPRNA
jgi:hypothetical protein